MQPKMYPVFVDNISEDVRTADLRSVFARHGDVVEVTIVSDHGFVIFGNPDDALEAISRVNGQELNGNRLTVDVSKELEEYLHERNKDYSDEPRRNTRPRDNYDRDNYRGRGRERGRRGWIQRGGRGRGFRGRGARRGYGRFSPNSRSSRRSRSPGDKSYQYEYDRDRSPKSRRYSMGDEKRRSYSPMVKKYPPPEDENRYHHYKGTRGGRGKSKPSPPRRGQNIFPSRTSRSPSPMRSTSRSYTRSPSRYDRSYCSESSKIQSRSSRSRSRSQSRPRLASEIIKHPRHSSEAVPEPTKGSKMDSFGFFTASNFVEAKVESNNKSPARPLPATSPITSTSANETTLASTTNEDEAESEEHQVKNGQLKKQNNQLNNVEGSETKVQQEIKSTDAQVHIEKANLSNQNSSEKQVDLREILKNKKSKDKSKSIDEAFEAHPLKRKKNSSSTSSIKGHTNIQIKVERESESIRTIMVGANEKSKQVKVYEDENDKMESDRYLKSSLPPPSTRAGMPPTLANEIENNKAEKFDMEKCQKLFIGNLFNPVEHEDLEMLLEEFGPIRAIKRYEKHAIVTIECSKDTAEEACKALDHNYWMDNYIRVKFNRYPFSKEEANAIRKNKQTAGQRNIDRWYAQHDNRDEITLYRDASPEHTTSYRDRNPSSESTGVQEEREPKKPKITLKSDLDSKFIASFSNPEVDDINEENDTVADKEGIAFTQFPDTETTKEQESLALMEKMKRRKPTMRKIRSFRIYCATTNKNFMSDIVEVFTRFGAVKSNEWEGPCIAIDLESTEKKAVQCIFETNKIKYKGQDLRVKFKDGIEEDKNDFHELYEDEFKNYPKDLVPTFASQIRPESTSNENKATLNKNDELPIGVLPQSSSLGAFGAPGIPDQDMLSSIIQKARENMIKNESSNSKTMPTNFSAPCKEPLYNAYAIETAPLKDDPQYVSKVKGHIHSVNNKVVLIKFQIESSWRLAKLSPGTMYVDGKKCLGYLIKNNTFHMWPQALKDFLYQDAVVKMDVKKIYDEEEITETRELTGESVTYLTPLVWKTNFEKPTEKDITISRIKQKLAVLKGNVTSIYPKWGVIATSKGQVFFEINHVYIDNTRLDKSVSLLNFIEKGDTLAVQCVSVPDYLEMSEIARSAPGFRGRTDTLKYHARLVWHLNAEVDPYSVHDSASTDFSDIECNFLTTSSTLNKPLPSDRDIIQRPRRWAGRVEEIHLPAGGVILLDENLNLQPYQRYAYFHRSRIYANGSKISSSTSLNDEIVPGDRVEVDVIENMQPGVLKKSNAYVASEAYWIALSVHLKSNERGVLIARSLRMEGLGNVEPPKEGPSSNIGIGRIVHFFAPKDNSTEPVSSGVAVIDCGEYAGQRVEFEAGQCEAFGYSLENADLSQIFNYNERVFIQVKTYNSYCVEKLWVGSRGRKIEDLAGRPEEVQAFQKYLLDHGLDVPSFNSLIKGHYQTRHFLPSGGQILKGKVKQLKSDNVKDASTNYLVVEADVGDILFLEAYRESIYIHGHWMGKADLNYVLEVGDVVHFEFHPVFEKSRTLVGGALVLPRASLLWLGDEDSRPLYHGQATRPTITPKMDAQLWEFVQKKNMDQKMFRALVEGRLQPKPKDPATEPKETNVIKNEEIKDNIDPETMQMATLLTKMKSSFGDSTMLQAMMLMMANKKEESSNNSSNASDQMSQMMRMAEMLGNKNESSSVIPPTSIMEQAVAGPSGYTFPAPGDPSSNIKKDTSPTPTNLIGGNFQMRIPPKKF